MLKAFTRVGYLSESMLKEKLGIAERRVTNFLRDRYIEKCSLFDKKTKTTEEVYRLTELGLKFVERELGVECRYRSSSASHDLALANKYLSLPATVRDSWKTESTGRDLFMEKLESLRDEERFEEYEKMLGEHLISPVDAIYVNEQGETIGFEIITDSYGQSEIQAKHEFCSIMGMQEEFVRI